MLDHPRHLLRRAVTGCKNKITFVLPILVVHDYKEFAIAESLQRLLDVVKLKVVVTVHGVWESRTENRRPS